MTKRRSKRPPRPRPYSAERSLTAMPHGQYFAVRTRGYDYDYVAGPGDGCVRRLPTCRD